MHSKLANGHLPLHEMVSQQLRDAGQKLAAAQEEKKGTPAKKPEEKKDKEKTSSIIDVADVEEVEKVASALDFLSEKLASDSIEIGGESPQGGEQIPTQGKTPGTQPYKKDSSKKHSVPMHTGMETPSDNKGAATAVPTDANRAPGGTGAKYPANGVLRKTAGTSVHEKIASKRKEAFALTEEGHKLDAGKNAYNPFGGMGGPSRHEKKEKRSSAVDFLLGKIAESQQGGMVLSDDKASAPVPSNPGRELISNNNAPAKATKLQAKTPVKKDLKEVLTEPAMTRSTDSKVHENLQNATKGGVKIAGAAAKAFIQKVASDPNDPRHGKLMAALAARQNQ